MTMTPKELEAAVRACAENVDYCDEAVDTPDQPWDVIIAGWGKETGETVARIVRKALAEYSEHLPYGCPR